MSETTERADRLKLFLADEAVQATLAAMKEQNYRLFVGAPNEAGRAQAQAQAIVLEGFEGMLQATLDAGERETLEQEQRDRAPATR